MSDADLRIDPLTGAYVVVTPWRQQRPNRPDGLCPFCPGGLEAPEPYDVRHFPNRWPALPFALGAGVYAAASRRSDGRIALASRQAGDEQVVLSIDTLEPGSVDGWAAYPAGVAWALREAGYLSGGADVAIDADLPAGAGLSSSAALECAVALALTELYQVPGPRRELAALARRAENVFAGGGS